jgi:hypothetical protein
VPGIPVAVTSDVIARLDRAIQYAAAYRLKRCRLWDTGSPAFAGDDHGESNDVFLSSFFLSYSKTWMAGTSPAMTADGALACP